MTVNNDPESSPATSAFISGCCGAGRCIGSASVLTSDGVLTRCAQARRKASTKVPSRYVQFSDANLWIGSHMASLALTAGRVPHGRLESYKHNKSKLGKLLCKLEQALRVKRLEQRHNSKVFAMLCSGSCRKIQHGACITKAGS